MVFMGTTSPFGQLSTSAFGSSFSGQSNDATINNSSSLFGPPSSNRFGTSVFGHINNASSNTTSPCGSYMDLTPSQSSPYSSLCQATQPTFVNYEVGFSTPFGTSSQPALGAVRTHASGSSSSFGITTSSSPSYSFGSIPAFGSPFTLGTQATTEIGGWNGTHPAVTRARPRGNVKGGICAQLAAGKIVSLSAMPIYEDKSHEELRWEDYKLGDYGCTVFGKKAGFEFFGPGQSQSRPFGSIFGPTQPAIGSNQFGSSTNFGASSRPAFGATANLSSATPGFGVSSTPSFGFGSTPSFGISTYAVKRSPFDKTSSPFGRQSGGSRVAAYTPTTEVDDGKGGQGPAPRPLKNSTEQGEASTSQWSKKMENLRMALEMEREVEHRVSQRHINLLTSVLDDLDNLNTGEGKYF